MVQRDEYQKGKGKAIGKEPMEISSTFASALNRPLPRGVKLFLMPPLSAPQKLMVKVGKNPYTDSVNPHFHPFKGKGEASVQLNLKEEVNNYEIRRDKGPGSRQIAVRECQNHHPYIYKDQKSLLQPLAVNFLGEQKTISSFLGLGRSSRRTPPNPALNPNLRNETRRTCCCSRSRFQFKQLRQFGHKVETRV